MGKLVRFIIAALVCFTLASIAHTQFVLAEMASVDVTIQWSERLQMTFKDWLGLLPTYGIIIGLGLLLAFLVAGGIEKATRPMPAAFYGLAGFVALLAIHAAMQPIMGITLIAGARTLAGLLTQAVAGFVGGWLFVQMRPAPRRWF
ncbi:hypothetical protein HMF8227_00705 [Saliniradius amylolyticus]|uniref:Uncharacterized protein n=1 Tax=Saliniradius amylolyticus TaxID=2183582 RepID=A0A2S2E0M8_9ALTE|nr:hypothetical protein [Saliniradius amylolyticus]AWL11201.1 hypothetical protein HMF8227_00705 [Saliniradius amylolyticus]